LLIGAGRGRLPGQAGFSGTGRLWRLSVVRGLRPWRFFPLSPSSRISRAQRRWLMGVPCARSSRTMRGAP
jgi:hypothetical protein